MPRRGHPGPRLYGGAGVIPERDLLRSLRRVLLWHVLGLVGRKGYSPIDVLVLSLGYYHERPEDADFDTPSAPSCGRSGAMGCWSSSRPGTTGRRGRAIPRPSRRGSIVGRRRPYRSRASLS
ncbi:hypothetical protein NKG05_05500 [Oerskovia sp. M15]